MEEDYLKLLKNTISIGRKLHEQEQPNMELRARIKKFFRDNPNPSDSKVHEFASKEGIDPHQFEEEIYAILSVFVQVGKHQDDPDSKFDPKELEMGISVEKEHTDCPEIAKQIARDHLSEPGLEDYYTRLKKMEEDAKKEKGIKESD